MSGKKHDKVARILLSMELGYMKDTQTDKKDLQNRFNIRIDCQKNLSTGERELALCQFSYINLQF